MEYGQATSGQAKANQQWFDERAVLHTQSEFYRVQDVIDGEIRLNDHEIDEVGPVKGKDLIQLQCHIGLEAVSWARLGATTQGLDFSAESIVQAERIAEQSGVDIRYHCGDVYDAPEIVGEDTFDVAYVNGGSLHWLPDLNLWGKTVAKLLRPGGILYLNHFHPVSLVLDDETPTFARDYFDRGSVAWEEPGSYADASAETSHNVHVVWDRPVSDIITAVIEAGLTVTRFQERPGQEFKQFPYQEQREDGLWYNPAGMGVHPSTFSLRAVKTAVGT